MRPRAARRSPSSSRSRPPPPASARVPAHRASRARRSRRSPSACTASAKLETVLVGANALDVQGGTIIAAGMRLEVPAPGHHTVMQGETLGGPRALWLGTNDMARTELLAHANKGVPWVPPVEGQEIEIPAVVTYLAGEGETVNTIAARFWGDPNRGWELNTYNRREGVLVRRGEVMLVAMPGLRLTEAGRAEARAAAERDGASGGMALEQQRRADAELPAAPRGRALRALRGGRRARQPPRSAAARSRTRSSPSSIAPCSRPTSRSTPAPRPPRPAPRGSRTSRSPVLDPRPRVAEDPRRVRRRVRADAHEPLLLACRPLSAGRKLDDKFEIVGVLGEGGMGIVYDARRIVEGDRVALKVIHQHLAGDAQIRGRFAREVAILRRLEGDHLCPVLDFGEIADPRREGAGPALHGAAAHRGPGARRAAEEGRPAVAHSRA